MRNWKTLLGLSIAFSDFRPRIYSNFQIYQDWKSILNKHLKSYQEVERIRFSYTPWVIIIDEWWLNVNSKDWFKETSRIMQKVLFLAWKKNCSVIFIAQRYNSVDVNFRELADAIFECKKIPRKNTYPFFIINKYKQKWIKFEYDWNYEFDIIKWMNYNRLSYNTLEESEMRNEKNDNKDLIPAKKIVRWWLNESQEL